MAYTAPPQWSHLDYPTAAKLNLYKQGLDAIYAQTGGDVVNVAITRRIVPVQGYYLVNRHRWLIYACTGTGTIEDPSGVGEDVSLSAVPAWAAVDLMTVDWIYPGKLYQVQGVVNCFEDYEDI